MAYVLRSLTDTECIYPQKYKELLAVVFSCERFHSYLYVREVYIQTDHKPLVPNMDKALHKVPPRLQRLLLRLQRYNIAKLTYVPGKYFTLPTHFQEHTCNVLLIMNQTLKVKLAYALEADVDTIDRMKEAYDRDPEI